MANRIMTAALTVSCAFVGFALLRPAPTVPPLRFYNSRLPPAAVDEPALLERPIAEVRLKDVPLEDALMKLADMAGVNLCVEWRTLEYAELDAQAHLTLILHNVTLYQAIQSCFKESTSRNFVHLLPVHVYAESGIVTVTVSASQFEHVQTEFFNVRPLVDKLIPGAAGPRRGRESRPPTPEDILDELSKLITSKIDPGSWRESGGAEGEILNIGGVLVITQTRENLNRIRTELDELKRCVSADDLPVTTRSSSAEHGSDNRVSNVDSKRSVTEYVNLRSIIDATGAVDWDADPDSKRVYTRVEAHREVDDLLMHSVDSPSWRDNGGTDGYLLWIGDVLAVTQTPGNIQAVRSTLGNLSKATSRTGGLSPTTRNALPTTNESKNSPNE